jgi:hypothetical protein
VKRRTHLNNKDIASYVKSAYGSISQRDQLESHIENCEQCCLKAVELEQKEIGYKKKPFQQSAPTPECPPMEDLQAFACGILDRETARDLFLHVAACYYCAPLLKEYLDAIDTRPSLWERFRAFGGHIPGLAIMLSFIQQRPVWRWAAIPGLAALVLGIAAPPAINVYELWQAQKYIQAYYNEMPSTEMRVAWFRGHPQATSPTLAGESPAQHSASSSRPSSETLNYEHARILVMGHKESTDPRWMLARARLEMITSNQQNQSSAIELLLAAQAKGLNDPATQNDLATAYYQMGYESNTSDFDALNESLRILTKILENPKLSRAHREVVQYNQAMVSERLGLAKNAILQWNAYLELDQDQTSAWRSIAQQRLEALKKKPPRQGHANPEAPHSF